MKLRKFQTDLNEIHLESSTVSHYLHYTGRTPIPKVAPHEPIYGYREWISIYIQTDELQSSSEGDTS